MTTIFNEQIYDPAFSLDGPHLVAASAGTGKTYNIQNVCARLVMERKDLRVPEIQVMTFTDAATKELHDRVRKVFANLSLLFAGREDEILDKKGRKDVREIERLAKLRECARRKGVADRIARGRVERALQEFDLAAISTIHGFCNRAMKRFAFETGAAFQAELRDNKAADLRRRTRDWWRTHHGDGAGDEFPALVDLQDAVTKLGGKSEYIVDDADATLAAAKEIVGRYEDDRPTRETQTFDDLLRAVRDALRHKTLGPIFAERLRGDLKAVVVDEFQDTDPAQYEIIRQVFLDVPTGTPQPPLFFVGDPKQAIYSFRGGDIYTYRKAAERDDVRANASRLDRNFRSTPRLLDAVNALFRDPDGGGFTFGDKTIGYPEDLKAAEGEDERIPGLLVKGKEDTHPFRIVEFQGKPRDVLHLVVADAVVDVLNEQKGVLTPKDVAILVPVHKTGRAIRDELRKRGVPVVLQKAGNVFAGDTAKDFRKVLLAMAGIGGRRQIRAALATPFFDFAETEFPAEGDPVFADMVGAFAKWNGVWRKKGFAAAFAALESHGRCRLRPRFAKMADGERRLADIFQIVDLAGAAVRERGPAPEVLVDWLTERINLAGDEKADEQWGKEKDKNKAPEADSDEFARELESESDAVKIMTLHVSKGLEFPVTVVPAGTAFSVSSPYFHHDDEGCLHVSADDADADAAQAEEDAEHTRKLYVAFTRATKRTIVVTPPPAEGSPLARLLANAVARKAGPDNPDSPILWTEWQPPAAEAQPAAYVAEKPPLGQFSDAASPRSYDWFFQPVKGSYSSLIPKKKGKDDESEDDDESNEDSESTEDQTADDPDYDAADADDVGTPSTAPSPDGAEENPIFGFRGGDKIGTCWHDILEKVSFDANDADIKEATRRSLRLHGLANRDPDAFEKDVGTVAGMVRKTLDWPLASPVGDTFFLRDVGWSDRFSEWEFHFPSRTAEVASTTVLAQILCEEWAGDKNKERFLDAAAVWRRPIPKGFLKGYLDLLFRHDGFYYVVDWKSNRLEGHAADFNEEGVQEEMAKHHYFLQYLLYSAVLHKFLRETMGPAYSWEKNFGGVFYYFLRGVAAGAEAPVFHDRPSERLLDRLCQALGLEDR